MTEEFTGNELEGRIRLIEEMIAEGRKSTESWGWSFVYWGIAYLVAITWSTLGHNPKAWLITMMTALALMVIPFARRGVRARSGQQPVTQIGRAMSGLWISLGISLMILLPSLGFSGRLDGHVFISVLSAMLGLVNSASSITLRWRAQMGCAVVWWLASIVACIGSESQSTLALVVAIFLCQIVFGSYAMILEHRRAKAGAYA